MVSMVWLNGQHIHAKDLLKQLISKSALWSMQEHSSALKIAQ